LARSPILGRLPGSRGLAPSGLGDVTLDGGDADPEGASCLGLRHAPPDGVHDLPTEVFSVRFHRSMMSCGPSSSQHAVCRDCRGRIIGSTWFRLPDTSHSPIVLRRWFRRKRNRRYEAWRWRGLVGGFSRHRCSIRAPSLSTGTVSTVEDGSRCPRSQGGC
jgi:hypothetical protein